MTRLRWLLPPLVMSFMPLVAQQLPEAKITVRVVDGNGVPIPNIEANVTFEKPGSKATGWGNYDVFGRRGSTDVSGLFSASEGSGNYVTCGANAIGFYAGYGHPVEFLKADDGKWQPWNPTVEVILKKILNPIPLYSRRVNRSIRVKSQNIGFDLSIGDFVVPNGQGVKTDLIFRMEMEERGNNDYNYRLLVSFPNEGDGIVSFNPTERHHGTTLRSGYMAPEDGYVSSWTVTRTRRPGSPEQSNYDPAKHGYYFRVRTMVDSTGKVVSANYGKIYGDFMNFTYYLNPTPNDRNVEFDPKHNLFTNLKPDERVTEP